MGSTHEHNFLRILEWEEGGDGVIATWECYERGCSATEGTEHRGLSDFDEYRADANEELVDLLTS